MIGAGLAAEVANAEKGRNLAGEKRRFT